MHLREFTFYSRYSLHRCVDSNLLFHRHTGAPSLARLICVFKRPYLQAFNQEWQITVGGQFLNYNNQVMNDVHMTTAYFPGDDANIPSILQSPWNVGYKVFEGASTISWGKLYAGYLGCWVSTISLSTLKRQKRATTATTPGSGHLLSIQMSNGCFN